MQSVSKSFTSSPVTFLNSCGEISVITSFRHFSRSSVRYMKIGTRVANLMSFSCISLRKDLLFFSSSVSCFFSFGVRFSSPSALAFFTPSDLLIIASISELRLRKPSIFISASSASLFSVRRLSVSLSTFTSSADSHRRASSVAEVPAIAISSTSCALIAFMLEPS